MKEKSLIIFGAGNSTVEIIDLIQNINKKKENKLKIIGILDDDVKTYGKRILDIPIIGPIKDYKKFKKEYFFLGMFHYKNRFKRAYLIDSLKSIASRFISIIHPDTIIGVKTKIGHGCFISNNCNINSHSSIGNFCNLNPNVSLAPRVKIKNNCFLGDGTILAFNTIIGKNTYIGIRSIILENIKIMDGSRILPNTIVHKQFSIKKGIIAGEPSRFIGFEKK